MGESKDSPSKGLGRKGRKKGGRQRGCLAKVFLNTKTSFFFFFFKNSFLNGL